MVAVILCLFVFFGLIHSRQFRLMPRRLASLLATGLSLATVATVQHLFAPPTLAGSPDKAAVVYRKLCQRCHEADGKGGGAAGLPDFTQRSWHDRRTDTQLSVSIMEGKGTRMPGFRSKLDQAQLKALVAYVRDFAPGREIKKPAAATPVDFELQFEKLQKEYDELQRQLRELAKEGPRANSRTARANTGVEQTNPGHSSSAAAAFYQKHCQRCHGPDGKGVVAKLDVRDPPDFSRSAWHHERSDTRLLSSILDGKGTAMPAYRKQLTEEAARDLVDYIRGFAAPSTTPRGKKNP
jgi:mono/diheme cytochrome c family protein